MCPPPPPFLIGPPPTLPPEPEVAVEVAPVVETPPVQAPAPVDTVPAPGGTVGDPVAEPVATPAPEPTIGEVSPGPRARQAVQARDPETESGATRAREDLPQSTALLRPGTRKFFLSFSVGRSFLLGSDSDADFDSYFSYTGLTPPALRLEQQAGLHGRSGSSAGFSAALSFQQVFLSVAGNEATTREYVIGPRLAYDVSIGNLGVYVTPSFQLGYNLHTNRYSTYGYYGDDMKTEKDRTHRMDVQFGLAAKVLLADRLLLSFRPFDLQIVTKLKDYSLRWNVMGGIGITL